MIFKNKIALVFFILSLVFAFVSMPFSAALKSEKLDRGTSAMVVDDGNGALKLQGFNDTIYTLNWKYTSIGSITNNTNQTLTLTITIIPDFSTVKSSCEYGIKIGSVENVFTNSSSSPKQATITLTPGQIADVQGYLIQNKSEPLSTEFQFSAKNAAGAYVMQFNNTVKTPRRIVCR